MLKPAATPSIVLRLRLYRALCPLTGLAIAYRFAFKRRASA